MLPCKSLVAAATSGAATTGAAAAAVATVTPAAAIAATALCAAPAAAIAAVYFCCCRCYQCILSQQHQPTLLSHISPRHTKLLPWRQLTVNTSPCKTQNATASKVTDQWNHISLVHYLWRSPLLPL